MGRTSVGAATVLCRNRTAVTWVEQKLTEVNKAD